MDKNEVGKKTVMVIKFLFFAAVVAISMFTTGMFFAMNFKFATYWPQWLNQLIGVVVGIILLDGGALAWLKIYLSGCDNNDERMISQIGFVVSATGSALTSMAQFITSTTLIQSEIDSGWVAIAIGGIAVIQFILAMWMARKSTLSQIEESMSALTAQGVSDALKRGKKEFEDNHLPGLVKDVAANIAERAGADLRQVGNVLKSDDPAATMAANPPAKEPEIVSVELSDKNFTNPGK